MRLFKAIGNEARLKILFLLTKFNEIGFFSFSEILNISQPNISYHLNSLEQNGLITTSSKGKWKYCQISDPGRDLIKGLTYLQGNSSSNADLPLQNLKFSDQGREMSDLLSQYITPEIKWIFKALKNTIRIRLLLLLTEEQDICFCELVSSLKLLKSTLSHHLSILEFAELITTYTRGKWKYYRITDLGKRVLSALK